MKTSHAQTKKCTISYQSCCSKKYGFSRSEGSTNKQDIRKTGTLSGVPPQSSPKVTTSSNLTGVPDPLNVDSLPDLVSSLETNTNNSVDPNTTEEELEAADALLSLEEAHDTAIEDNDNALLMPIGAPTNVIDAAPVPMLLDQINVDNAIANIIEAEELEKEGEQPTAHDVDGASMNKTTTPDDAGAAPSTVPDSEQRPKSASPTQGSLKIKTHSLEKKTDSNRRYKCSVCGVSKPTVQQMNVHHFKKHKPQICPVCGCTFALASSLIGHAYDHEEKYYKCEFCDYSAHFESELKAHKIAHRKEPAFQCMMKNCGKWFQCKWELTMHIKKHDGAKLKCDECDFTTNLDKNLKEHKRKHSNDCPNHCKICDVGSITDPG